MPVVLKSGSLNLLEPSGPAQAFSGIALPLERSCAILCTAVLIGGVPRGGVSFQVEVRRVVSAGVPT